MNVQGAIVRRAPDDRSQTKRARNAAIRGLVVVLLWVVDRSPRRPLRALGGIIGSVAFVFLRAARTRAISNIRIARPTVNAPKAARAAFAQAGRNLMTCLELRRPGVRARELVHLPEADASTLRAAIATGRGVILVSAHIGPFEATAAALSEAGFECSVVVRESYDPQLDPVVDHHRLARGLDVIHRGRPGASARMLRTLRSGGTLALLADLSSSVRCGEAQMLGGSATTPLGPALLSQRRGCELLYVSLQSGPRGLEIRIRPLRGATVAGLHQAIADAHSAAVRRIPEHWLWMATTIERLPTSGRGVRSGFG